MTILFEFVYIFLLKKSSNNETCFFVTPQNIIFVFNFSLRFQGFFSIYENVVYKMDFFNDLTDLHCPEPLLVFSFHLATHY